MKKQFFYAALAIALMSSCSKDNDPGSGTDPVNPTPDVIDETTPVAIELGVQVPAVTVSTRAHGSVGGEVDASNLWKGEKLYILAYDKGAATLAQEVDPDDNTKTKYIFDGLTFKAPEQNYNDVTNTASPNNILILKDPTTVQAKYYTPDGKFDFFGYHIDDIPYTETPEDIAAKTVSALTITGAEDIMAAQTKEITEANYPDAWASHAADTDKFAENAFNAWASRRNIKPILDFKHLLTRLKFNVTAGKEEAAQYYYNTTDGAWKSNEVVTGVTGATAGESTAVHIYKIEVWDIAQKIDINYGAVPPTATITTGATAPVDAFSFDLQTRTADGTMGALTATAPKCHENEANKNKFATDLPAAGDYETSSAVGESLMIPAGLKNIRLKIYFKQLTVDTEDLDGNALSYKEQVGSIDRTIPITAVTKDGTALGADASFAAGYSYNINVKVFDFQRIEISATLSKWELGGNVDIDAE